MTDQNYRNTSVSYNQRREATSHVADQYGIAFTSILLAVLAQASLKRLFKCVRPDQGTGLSMVRFV